MPMWLLIFFPSREAGLSFYRGDHYTNVFHSVPEWPVSSTSSALRLQLMDNRNELWSNILGLSVSAA